MTSRPFPTGVFFTSQRYMLLIGSIILIIAAGNLWLSHPLGDLHTLLTNPGLYIDTLALIFLISIAWSSNILALSQIAVNWVRVGLLLWIAGATFDLMDEIVFQPRWEGYFCEDLTRLTGMLITAVGIYKIISRINMLYVNARSQSLRDELTQLPNRRFFIDTIREKANRPLGLMILDIDFFKKINDTWGHLVGG